MSSFEAPTSIDMRVPVLTKVHGSYYKFMDKCFALVMRMLKGKIVYRLHQIGQELEGENKIEYWYFLKEMMVIIRCGYFENLFLLPKFVTPQIYYLKMGRQISAIETKYGSSGNFKPMIKMSVVVRTFILIEVDCKEELSNFIIKNFKLEKIEGDWMYEPLG